MSDSYSAMAVNDVTLFTPYSKISVAPGETITYNINVINNSKEIQNVPVSVSGVPRGWNCILKSGGWKISQIAVMPGEKQELNLILDVPLQVNKGTYRFKVEPKGFDPLLLAVTVSEQGTFRTELTTRQSNLQGSSTSNFTYEAQLRNLTADNQVYALNASTPQGWVVTFNCEYKQVSSLSIDANHNKILNITVIPPLETKAGTYNLSVSAVAPTTSATLDLQTSITGNYSMVLTTPTGLLSDNISEGEEKKIKLLVKNTGSAELNNIKLTSSSPANWEVTFDPKIVDKVEPGESADVWAIIKVARKAIVGDYITRFEANSHGINAKADFRVSVKTPLFLGWAGILIILIVILGVFYLFQRYGRR